MTDTGTQIIEADLTWQEQGFREALQVVVDPAGRIERVGALGLQPTRRLAGRALLPGFVNAHSHAFQRGLRGAGERFPQGAGSFWTWRQAMYGLVESMDESRMHELSCRAFREMLAAGITTVGEFHYLHHDRTAGGYALDEVVLRAAAETGIRIVLLLTDYTCGGIDEPLDGAQRRFDTGSLDGFWSQVDALQARLDPATQTLGVAAHSIRAVPLERLAALHAEAMGRGLVFHMHLEEQPREIEACLRRYGQTPMALVNRDLAVGPGFTAVHCTHTATADLDDFLAAGGTICICPLTEANLGDGLANLRRIRRRAGRVCLGTDSNARISFLEEMRWLEYGQRLIAQERGVVCDETGRLGGELLRCGTRHGAAALGLKAGAIAPGDHADLVAVDLAAPALAGWTPDTLIEALILGGGDDVVAGACVGGRWTGPDPACRATGGRARS